MLLAVIIMGRVMILEVVGVYYLGNPVTLAITASIVTLQQTGNQDVASI
jgi:hypothetical protein